MLSISVAVYNLPDITRRCLESLERTLEGVPFEVLVFDNHSTDPAIEALYAALDPQRYQVVRSPANLGYRGAHRANARRFSGDWFVIINNDILFDECGWHRKLAHSKRLGAIGVRGDVCNALTENGAGYYDPRATRTPMYVDGHFMAIPRDVLHDEGLFEDDQIDFCYFEDSDHTFTLREKGYRFEFVPIGLTHFRGSTTRSLAAEERLFLVQTFEHNRWRFHTKWGDEVRRLRAALDWEQVEIPRCPKRPSPAVPVTKVAVDLITRALDEHRAGRLAAAETLYVEALQKGGRSVPAADNLLAVLLMDTGRIDKALEHARRAVAAEPGNASYLATLGNAEQAAGKWPDAFRTYLCARRLNPADELVLYNLGRLCIQCQMPEEAGAFYLKAIEAAPALLPARYGLGRALVALGRLEEAAQVFAVVIAANPGYEDAALELSQAYINLARYDEAEDVLKTALTHRPHAHALRNNLGVVLHKRGSLEAARAAFDAALAGDPDNAEYLSNAGLTRAALNDLDGAIAAYRTAIARSPDFADAHWNLSLALLLSGHYREGWQEYRWGLRKKRPRAIARHFARPSWEDGDPGGKRILLYAEQGFGDMIQFVRYASEIAERGGHPIVQCQRGLRQLLADVPGAAQVIEEGDALPAFDAHASIFDAPRVLGTTVDTIPSACGYIRADPGRIDAWRAKLSHLPGLKVGLVWQGRPTHEHDWLRSIPLQELAALLAIDGVSFVSLQKGHGSDQIAGSAFAGRIVDDTALWDADGDGIFLDTAATIANLDLTISIDSAVTHLAGAMGCPVWTLLQYSPDWRWLLGRDDSPWYPSMRLFRQTTFRDWSGPISRVAAALADLPRR